MKVIIRAEAKMIYKKEVEMTQEEFSELQDDFDHFGNGIASSLLNLELHSPDCQDFDWDYVEIEEKAGDL